jgi:hypothetical protein
VSTAAGSPARASPTGSGSINKMRMRPATGVLMAVLAWGASVTSPEETPPVPSALNLRVNQVGYRPSDSKVALALTDRDLRGQRFEVRTQAGDVLLSGTVGRDRGRYGRFAHV